MQGRARHGELGGSGALLALLATLGAFGCEQKAADIAALSSVPDAGAEGGELLLGEVAPLSGPEAPFGLSAHRGIELAVREINANGGIRGQTLKVATVDDRGQADLAVEGARKLVAQGARVVIGELTSSRSMAMAPELERAAVPMISPASTSPKVTAGRKFVFRVCFADPFQGQVMARFAREELGLVRVAVLEDASTEYSTGLARAFAARFKALGGQVVAKASYSAGTTDFSKPLQELAGASPEAVYVPGYFYDVAVIAKQARQAGLKAPLLGGDGWSSQELLESSREQLEGSYFTDHYSTQDPRPRVQRFVDAYRQAYGVEPDSFAALGYDAVRLTANAIARASSLDGTKLRDALAAAGSFEGVTGVIAIDPWHDARKAAIVVKIEGGRPVYQAAIAPE